MPESTPPWVEDGENASQTIDDTLDSESELGRSGTIIDSNICSEDSMNNNGTAINFTLTTQNSQETTSSAISKIDQQLSQLDPLSIRAKTLAALRNFRCSWIDLGRLLSEVARGGDYKEWGYDSFDTYCTRELNLRKPTVAKLTLSYNYLRTHEPRRLQQYEETPRGEEPPIMPDCTTVDLLRKARNKASLSGESEVEVAEQLHNQVFNGEIEEPVIRREIRETLRPKLSPDEMLERQDLRLKEIAAIRKLADNLLTRLQKNQAIPEGLRYRLEECCLELSKLD